MSEESYDLILLGTGHNALVLQAYLSRAGLRTLALDRADTPGGGLSTTANPRHPGFLHNPHAFFHRAITAMPWYRDLELARHGVDYIEPELNVAMILPDGRSLKWWTDIDKTASSFAEFSQRDADSLRRWHEEFAPIVENILIPESRCPPLDPDRRRELLLQSSLGRRLLEVSALSPLEFVEREFESDAIRAGLLFFNGLREVDLRLHGFGHAIPALLASRHMAQMCIGGASALAAGLVADIEEHGGEIRLGVRLDEILTENGAVSGVALAGGERIAARCVASGLNPQQTFLDLLPESAVAASIREQARGFQYNLLAPLYGLHLALDEPLRFAAAETDPALDDTFMYILGLEHFEQFDAIVKAHEAGEFPPTVAWGASPTRFDPSQAPSGKHTAFLWEKLPFHLHGDSANWKNETEPHAKRLLEFWTRHAPHLAEPGVIIDQFALSPADIETTLPNMAQGDLLVGAFANDQVGASRPFPGAGRYRTPVEGLYLCGGSTHPGGNITGLCGYNAATVLAADTGVEQWWESPDIEEALGSL